MFAKFDAFTVKPNFDASLALAHTAFASIERLSALNLSAARQLAEQSNANFKQLLGAKTPQSLFALQTAQVQPAIESTIAYSRSVYEIATQTQEQFSKAIGVQFTDTKEKISAIVEKTLQNAPAGSDVAVAAIRKTIDSANTAFDNINNVAKQVAAIAEANVAAATAATTKAAASIAKKAA